MADELWNQKLTRENIRDFYLSTVVMVYSSCYSITKEATRCENAIIKSYLDIYSKRNNIAGDRVIYEFGDILLANAKNIVAQYPLPADMTFENRLLDEYTRNSMLDSILSKIDSKSFKAMEFINTDVKNRTIRPKQMRKLNDLFQVTPLLILEIIVLAIIIWMVSYAAATLPYRHADLISSNGIFESASIQEKFINAISFYPIRIQTNKSAEEGFMPVPTVQTQATDESTEVLEETTINEKHEALKGFPTDRYIDYQWKDLLDNSVSLDISNRSFADVIIEMVPNFVDNVPKSPLFVYQEGSSRILFCGFDLEEDSIVARALLKSLVDYTLED